MEHDEWGVGSKLTEWLSGSISVVWNCFEALKRFESFGSSYSGTKMTFLSYSLLCAIRVQLKEDGETGQTSFNFDFYGCQSAQTKI